MTIKEIAEVFNRADDFLVDAVYTDSKGRTRISESDKQKIIEKLNWYQQYFERLSSERFAPRQEHIREEAIDYSAYLSAILLKNN